MNPRPFKCAQLVWKMGGGGWGGEKPSLKGQFVWGKVKQIHFMGDLNSIGEKCMHSESGAFKPIERKWDVRGALLTIIGLHRTYG